MFRFAKSSNKKRMTWQTSSKSHKVLFWSLAMFAIVMVVAVALALRAFNRETMEDTSPTTVPISSDDSFAQKEDVLETEMISGFVSEVISKKDSPEKWIKLSSPIFPTDMPDPKKTKSTTPEVKNATYLFYLEEKTEGVENITGGEWVNVTPLGGPSQKNYTQAKKIEVMKQ